MGFKRMLRTYADIMRPHHWLKNLLIFAPIFFGARLFEPGLLARSIFAFAAFSLAASSVYIFNDIMDRDSDRRHPTKRHRPVAAGAMPFRHAVLCGIAVLILGLLAGALVSLQCLNVLCMYVGLNLAYSLAVKHVAVFDVLCVAAGFVLRLLMGSCATGIPLSHWIVAVTFLLALFLALAKRRDDIRLYRQGNNIRKAIADYSLPFVDLALLVTAVATFIAHLMYTLSPETTSALGGTDLCLTTLFVFLGIVRYLQLVYVHGRSASPTDNLMGDPFLKIIVAGWVATFMVVIYYR